MTGLSDGERDAMEPPDHPALPFSATPVLVARARAAGDIRPDVAPKDLRRALDGFTDGNASPDWEASALRLRYVPA